MERHIGKKVDNERDHKEDQSHGKKREIVLAPLDRFPHFGGDRRRHGADGLEDGSRDHRGVARDHHDSHGLADHAADPEHDGRHDPGRGRRNDHAMDRLPVRGPERKRPFLVCPGDRADGIFHNADDRGDGHERERDGPGKRGQACRKMEDIFDDRGKHRHADKTDHDARDRGQKFHAGFQGLPHPARRNLPDEDRAGQPQRDRDHRGAERHDQGAEEKRDDPELGRLRQRVPERPEKEPCRRTDLKEREPVLREKKEDQDHEQDAGEPVQLDDLLDDLFEELLHEAYLRGTKSMVLTISCPSSLSTKSMNSFSTPFGSVSV